jgi:DNA-binding MarR family transcriptional regulator
MSSIVKLADTVSMPLPSAGPETPLGQTVDRLMRTLEELVHQVPGGRGVRLDPFVQATPEPPQEEIAVATATLLIAMRKLRDRAFGAELFSDPAWSILVELYVALAQGQAMSVGDACVVSALPLTSALRLCRHLQDRNLVVRERDPGDRRRVLLRLSDTAYQALTQILAGTRLGLRR